MKDFIIVGQGLAATALMHVFNDRGIEFVAIGKKDLSNCSRVAAGIWNPIVFKRMTKSWKADILIRELKTFYFECEKKLHTKFMFEMPILRGFNEKQEENLWLKKSKNELEDFLIKEIRTGQNNEFRHLNISMNYGIVTQSGYIDVKLFLDKSSEFFNNKISDEKFDYEYLKLENGKVVYKNIVAKNIVFCEGYLIKNNPYFKWIPLKPAKGELFTISAKELKLKNFIYNKNAFLLPIGNSVFRVGATYGWNDLSESPTDKGNNELNKKTAELFSHEYEILSHEAGVRPSSTDRRPILGRHPKYENMFVFNGLGTKGVMLAPYCAKVFTDNLLHSESIEVEMNVSRFSHLYSAI